MIDNLTVGSPQAVGRAAERAAARFLGVKVSTLRSLGLHFADRASVETWLAEAPAEALAALRHAECASRLGGRVLA